MKAINIQWDTDFEDNVDLPTEIDLPEHLADEEEISDYISDTTGFCHKGFEIVGYEVPEEIKTKIPECFYYAFGGEYVSIFGFVALIRAEDGYSNLDYNSSTTGYAEALKMSCEKLDMGWLFDYWDELPWYQSDIFDGWLADEVMKRFDSMESANPYYKYLLSKEGERL